MADTAGFRQMEITAENPVTPHTVYTKIVINAFLLFYLIYKRKSFMALPNKAYLEYYLTHDK